MWPLATATFLVSGGAGTVRSPATHTTRWVIDGDTIVLNGIGKIRYIGVNTPEMENKNHAAELLAEAARSFNHSLVNDRLLQLEYDRIERDRFGRRLAYVRVKRTGCFVNRILLEKGYGYFYPVENHRYDTELLAAQRHAMQQKTGIWKTLLRLPAGGKGVIGSRRSNRFHQHGCPYARRIHPGNRVPFRSISAAFWEGYAPCKKCLPHMLLQKPDG